MNYLHYSNLHSPHATTILAVRYRNSMVMAGDGQVTLGSTIMKHGAQKVRRIDAAKVLVGFAGSAADGFTLYERFEAKLKECGNQLVRAAVELAKEWRSDRYLRRLEAMMIAADRETMFILSGSGDVIQPDDSVAGIGSGGAFALAAARALVKEEVNRSAKEIAVSALEVASSICPYTNERFIVEELQ